MKHTLRILITGVVLLIALVVLRINDPFFIETARLKGLDYYQRTQQTEKSNNIVVVEIDEQSLDSQGQWPWSRDILSKGVEKAFENETDTNIKKVLIKKYVWIFICNIKFF